jgi:hypothetical protein
METIKFETNQPQVLALMFSEGKPVESQFTGSQVMFSTVDGRRMYLAPFVAEKIAAAGIVAKQQFEICKKQVGRQIEWQVRTHNATAGSVSEAKPAATPVQSDDRTHQEYNGNAHRDHTPGYPALEQALPAQAPVTKTSAKLMACLAAAIDAAAEAQTYAGHRGLKILFNSEDIRCLALSAFISSEKNGGRP